MCEKQLKARRRLRTKFIAVVTSNQQRLGNAGGAFGDKVAARSPAVRYASEKPLVGGGVDVVVDAVAPNVIPDDDYMLAPMCELLQIGKDGGANRRWVRVSCSVEQSIGYGIAQILEQHGGAEGASVGKGCVESGGAFNGVEAESRTLRAMAPDALLGFRANGRHAREVDEVSPEGIAEVFRKLAFAG